MIGIVFLFFFLPSSILLSRVKKKRCRSSDMCNFFEVCNNLGKCEEKKYFHCQSDEDCINYGNGKCEIDESKILGKCEKKKMEFSIIPDLRIEIESLDDDVYRSIGVRRDLERKTLHCDSHFEEQYHHLHRTRNAKKRRSILSNECAMNLYCGDPDFRNQYIDKKQYSVNLDWLVVKNDDWWKEAKDRISEMNNQISEIYNKAGFFFNSTMIVYGLDSISEKIGLEDPSLLEGFIVDKFDCGKGKELGGGFIQQTNSACISAEDLVKLLRGEDWNNKGSFQIMPVEFANHNRLGFGKFPWARLHGMMAFSKNVIMKGKTTIQHELGHGFGLMHVFRGYDSNICQNCVERESSDLTGDMISDTGPTPIHWECHQKDVENLNDPCHSSDGWDNLPLGNVMNYGKCRNIVSIQQAARMKCFQDVAFNFKYTSFIGETDSFFEPEKYSDDDNGKTFS